MLWYDFASNAIDFHAYAYRTICWWSTDVCMIEGGHRQRLPIDPKATRDPEFRTFPPGLFLQSWSVNQAAGGDNCYESNFYLCNALLSSIPTSIYTKNVFHQISGPGFWLMSLLLPVNKKFFHQFSFKLIKTFFISPVSICATLFIKVGGKVRVGGSPRLLLKEHNTFSYLSIKWIND